MTQITRQDATYALERQQNYLSNSDFITTTDSDNGFEGTNIHMIQKRLQRKRLHIPTKTGPKNYRQYDSATQLNADESTICVLRPNETIIIDPISSFLSPTGELVLNTGKLRLESMGKASKDPQKVLPHRIHSIRGNPEAIDELRRGTYGIEDPILKWNTRKIPDAVIRARLGGWTSDFNPLDLKKDPNIIQRRIDELFPNMKLPYKSTEERDELAKNFQYKSVTQAMYEDVDWDAKLSPPIHAPCTTYENGKADPLAKNEEFYSRPGIWQTVAGKVWDRIQERQPYFSTQEVSFTAHTKRGNQLPGYGGCIGGVNIEYMDDKLENFVPFTTVKTEQPKPTAANYKPNIPGYTGYTHQFKTTPVSHFNNDGLAFTTYAAYHRKLANVSQNNGTTSNNLNGDFARIQTKVPPSNPYNSIEMKTDPNINNSLDNLAQSMTMTKKSNFSKHLAKHKDEFNEN